MLRLGVTTCEAKSGYGLDLDTEVKMLSVIRDLDASHPMDLVATFMGAHAVPPEYEGRGDAYIELLCQEMIPYVKEHGLAEFCDVFCEDSVFDVKQSRRYLQCARDHGLGLKIHADEIEEIGGSQLAGQMGAVSAEHLIAIGAVSYTHLGHCFDLIAFFAQRFDCFVHGGSGNSDFLSQSFAGNGIPFVFFQGFEDVFFYGHGRFPPILSFRFDLMRIAINRLISRCTILNLSLIHI